MPTSDNRFFIFTEKSAREIAHLARTSSAQEKMDQKTRNKNKNALYHLIHEEAKTRKEIYAAEHLIHRSIFCDHSNTMWAQAVDDTIKEPTLLRVSFDETVLTEQGEKRVLLDDMEPRGRKTRQRPGDQFKLQTEEEKFPPAPPPSPRI